MLINVAVTELPTQLATVQENKSERIVVAPVAVVARDTSTAILIVAAANAKAISEANPDLLVVHVRTGL